jgi:hypothetical protein
MKQLLLLLFASNLLLSCKTKIEIAPPNAPRPIQKGLSRDTSTHSLKTDSAEPEGNHYKKVPLNHFIIADLNGNQNMDTAEFISLNGKKGILIRDGGRIDTIGAGIGFEEMGDDFSWVDTWGILEDSITYEIVIEDNEIKGSKEFKLTNPSIFVWKTTDEEAGGGIITFKDNKYQWVHQAE